MKQQTKYLIHVSGLFEEGYVKYTLLPVKSRKVKFDTLTEAIDFASKWRWKWLADLCCKTLNWKSKYTLRTYSVKQLEIQIRTYPHYDKCAKISLFLSKFKTQKHEPFYANLFWHTIQQCYWKLCIFLYLIIHSSNFINYNKPKRY